jgi:hypothetical protein
MVGLSPAAGRTRAGRKPQRFAASSTTQWIKSE